MSTFITTKELIERLKSYCSLRKLNQSYYLSDEEYEEIIQRLEEYERLMQEKVDEDATWK